SQCSNTHTRLRGALELLMPDMAVADLHTADKRFAAFRNSIGWRERRRRYSIWDVPILHGNSSSEVDFNELFRHPMLLKVYAAIIRGVKSAAKVMDGTSRLPKANTMQRLFGITYTTPGAIAACAI
ncbi:hypothetical protein B0H14DRAFT_2232514, partial [Mycena olivaceomarginata]